MRAAKAWTPWLLVMWWCTLLPAHPETGIVYVVRVTRDGRVLPVE